METGGVSPSGYILKATAYKKQYKKGKLQSFRRGRLRIIPDSESMVTGQGHTLSSFSDRQV
jgi:hypothetical protein